MTQPFTIVWHPFHSSPNFHHPPPLPTWCHRHEPSSFLWTSAPPSKFEPWRLGGLPSTAPPWSPWGWAHPSWTTKAVVEEGGGWRTCAWRKIGGVETVVTDPQPVASHIYIYVCMCVCAHYIYVYNHIHTAWFRWSPEFVNMFSTSLPATDSLADLVKAFWASHFDLVCLVFSTEKHRLTGSKSSAIQNSSSSMSSTSYNRSHSSKNGKKLAGLEDQKVARNGILNSSRTVAFDDVSKALHCTVVFCWAPFSPSSDTKTCLKSSSFQMKSSKGTKVRPRTVTWSSCTLSSIQKASEAFTVLMPDGPDGRSLISSPWASLSGADSLRTPKRPSYSELSPTQTHSKFAVSGALLSPHCQDHLSLP